jgi:hypothetical protein
MSFYSQYLNIQDSNATPGSTFFVDDTSVDSGNNTGWVFVDGLFVFVSGNQATTAVGTPSVAGDTDVGVIGFGVLSALGLVDIQTDNYIDVTGLQSVTSLGSVVVTAGATNLVTGFGMTSGLGTVLISGSSDIILTGLQANAQVGFGFVWGLIDDAQNPNWVDIPN